MHASNPSFGELLARLRTEHEPALSLRALAARAHYSHVYLWQVERGDKPVTMEVARRCDEALGAGGELVAVAEEHRADQMQSRSAARSARAGDAIDPELIGPLWRARERYEGMYQRLGGVSVRPRLLEFLRCRAKPLLDQAPSAPELCRAVGSLSALAGVCAYDSEDQAAANRHFQHAFWLARSARAPGFRGSVVSLLARQAMRGGEPVRALQQTGSVLARGAALSPGLQADLHCLRAEAFAETGDPAASAEQLILAYRMVDRIDPASEPPETRYLGPGLIEGRHAELLRARGELAEANAYARASTVIGRATHPRGRANRLVVLANVLLSRGEPEEAAVSGLTLLEIVAGMESRQLRRRIEALAGALRVGGSAAPVVRRFTEGATELLATGC